MDTCIYLCRHIYTSKKLLYKAFIKYRKNEANEKKNDLRFLCFIRITLLDSRQTTLNLFLGLYLMKGMLQKPYYYIGKFFVTIHALIKFYLKKYFNKKIQKNLKVAFQVRKIKICTMFIILISFSACLI